MALYWQYFHGGQFLLFKKKQKNQPQKPAPHPQKFKLLLDLWLQKHRRLTSILSLLDLLAGLFSIYFLVTKQEINLG